MFHSFPLQISTFQDSPLSPEIITLHDSLPPFSICHDFSLEISSFHNFSPQSLLFTAICWKSLLLHFAHRLQRLQYGNQPIVASLNVSANTPEPMKTSAMCERTCSCFPYWTDASKKKNGKLYPKFEANGCLSPKTVPQLSTLANSSSQLRTFSLNLRWPTKPTKPIGILTPSPGLQFLLLLEAPLSVEVPALDFQVAVHLEVSQVAVHLEVFQVAVHLEVLLPEPMRNEARKKSSLFFRFRCSWASETFKDTSFSPPASFYSRAGHQHLLMHISCTDPSYAELSYKTNLKKSSPHALAWNFWSCCRRHFLGRFWLWTFKWWSAWWCCCWGLSDIKTGKPNCGQQVDIVRALRFLFSFFAHFAMKFHGHKHAAACKLLFSRCVSPSPDT